MNAFLRRRWLSFAAIFAGPLAWTVVFLVIPYLIMFAVSFWTRKFPLFVPDFQLGNYVQIFAEPQYVRVLLQTLKIAALVSIASVVIGYPIAYFIAFCVESERMKLAIYMAVIVPLWVSYLLRAYIWKTILGTTGILNSFLIYVGVLDKPSDLFLYNQIAMVVTLTYIFIPFMVMPIYAALEKIPKQLIEASHDLGEGPFATFLRIILPLSAGSIIAGMTLTFCLCFGDFVASTLVGGADGIMIANILQSQFGAALNWPLGAAISTVILIIVLGVLAISDRFERTGRVNLG